MNGIWIEELGARHPDECGVYDSRACDCYLKDAMTNKHIEIQDVSLMPNGFDPITGIPIFIKQAS